MTSDGNAEKIAKMRPAPGSIADQLVREPYRFEFFQAVRLLRLMAGSSLGNDTAPRDEFVRFGAMPSNCFPPGEIDSFRSSPGPAEGATTEGPDTMVVPFFGMTGPQGALPDHYTQLVIDRVRHKDFALRDFLDLFNHRLISLFFRAWEKYRFPVRFEQARHVTERDQEDLFTQCLYCLVGLGTVGLQRRMEVEDPVFLFYGGHFAQRVPRAICLEDMLRDLFAVDAQVLQFQGQWMYLSVPDQTSMPSAACRGGRNNELGITAVVGERVWGVESKFRVRLGPMGYESFRQLLPTGKRQRPVGQFIRTYVGPEYDFDLQLVLNAEEVPYCCLGGTGTGVAQLGWNTWIHNLPMPRDADEAVFSVDGAPSH